MSRTKNRSHQRANTPTVLPGTKPAISWQILLGVGLIVLLACLVYWPALHGGFVLDDELLSQNKLVKSANGLYRLWFTTEPTDYWPVTSTSFWLEWRLWGDHPTGYHVANLAMHIADCLLLWLLLRSLTIPGAFLAALIFTIHPVNVESVAWIAQRKNVLALFFLLLATLCYFESENRRETVKNEASSASAWPWYLLSFMLFILGMLSKGSAVVLPPLLLLIIWWQRRISVEDVARMVPFFIVGALLTLLNVWFQTHGSDAIVRNVTAIDRLLGAAAVIGFYLSKVMLPVNLIFVYPQWNIESANPLWWLPLIGTLTVTVLLIWQRRTRFGRPLLFAWLFFCISLIPVMGFTDVGYMQYSLVADHYQHIALIAVATLIAASLSLWRNTASEGAQWLPNLLAVAYVACLTFLATQQSSEYSNPVTLYETTLQKNPACWLALNNLGNLASYAGHKQEAIEHYTASLQLKPDQPKVLSNLGAAQIEIGQTSQGFDSLRAALKFDPSFADAEYNWGVALRKIGQLPEAIEHLQRAVDLKHDNAQHYNNLGQVLLETGNLEGAIKNLELARQLDPDDVNSCTVLAIAYQHAGRFSEALQAAQQGQEIATAQHQPELAAQIQAWINKQISGQSKPPASDAR
jgi:protein O-mannosyl-transferase